MADNSTQFAQDTEDLSAYATTDFSEFEQDPSQAVTDEDLKNFSKAGETVLQAAADIQRLKQLLEERQASYRDLVTKRMVDLMDGKIASFKSADKRFEFKLEDLIEGSFPNAEKKPEQYKKAVEWLHANNHEGLLKRFLTYTFAKGGDWIAERLKNAVYLELEKIEAEFKRWPDVDCEDEVTVHHMTLKSWAREMKKNGDPFPAEDLGLYMARIVKVKKC